MNIPGELLTQCDVCSSLSESEYGYSKYGWLDHAINLPDAFGSLVMVKNLKPLSGDRQLLLYRCPGCGAWFLYRSDYEYLTNGTEDEQFLTRLSEEEAAEYLNRPVLAGVRLPGPRCHGGCRLRAKCNTKCRSVSMLRHLFLSLAFCACTGSFVFSTLLPACFQKYPSPC